MKSSRNPPAKKLRVFRRMTSDVQCSDENFAAASELDMSQDSESAVVSEGLPARPSEVMPVVSSGTLVSHSTTDVSGSQSVDVPLVGETEHENSRVVSSFQSEFLKMLSQKKHIRRRIMRQKLEISEGSSCSQTNSQQATVTHVQNAHNGGMEHATGSSSVCAETSSLTCDSGTVSPIPHLNSKLVSSGKHESETEFVAADSPLSSVQPSHTAVTCDSCEVLGDELLALEQSCSSVQSDVLPPILSLPDPLTDVGICPRRPPVLEPSYVASDNSSSTTVQTVSDAIIADISVTSFTYEHTRVVEMSDSIVSELQTDKKCETHSTEMSSVDVKSVVNSPVGTVVCAVNDPTMRTMSSDTTQSLTLSAVTAAAVNTQQQSQVDTSSAVPRRISSLAQFRPTISVSSLLPLTNCYSSFTPPPARPSVHVTPRQQPRDRI